MHHTKEKGDLGVLKAQLDLFEQGFMILNPVTEHAPFDLVAYKDGLFIRLQVKYKSVDKHGCLTVHFRSSWADKNGSHMRIVDKAELRYKKAQTSNPKKTQKPWQPNTPRYSRMLSPIGMIVNEENESCSL
jgi:hypothetical protein